jgi:hypothetical protein
MANITTDPVATYTAQVLRGTDKSDDTPHADADVATRVIANWADDVDADLEELNASARGAAGAYVWVTVESVWDAADAVLRYVPIAGEADQTAEGNYHVNWCAPTDGQVVRATIYNSGAVALGSTVIGVHVADQGDAGDAVARETDTVDCAAIDTGYSFDFTSASAFTKGERLAFSVDPTNDHDQVSMTVLIKLDTNTL